MENDIIVQLPLKEFDRLRSLEKQLYNVEKQVGEAVYFFTCEELQKLGYNNLSQIEIANIIGSNVVSRVFPDYLKNN